MNLSPAMQNIWECLMFDITGKMYYKDIARETSLNLNTVKVCLTLMKHYGLVDNDNCGYWWAMI